jgi:hypothetical protein
MLLRKEYARIHGISEDTVIRRVKAGELNQVKKNGRAYIVEDSDDPSPAPVGGRLKEMKTAVEIKWIQQRIKETEENVRLDERTKMKEALLQVLRPIPESFRNAKLTQEQFSIINEAFNKSLTAVEAMK